MSKDYLFFISHNSKDNLLAQQLYDILLEGHPEWAGQIFLDCSREKPLETKEEWQNAMMKAVEDSRHLIFVTSDVAHLKEGNGWVYEEVNTFKNRKATRHRDGRAHKNISYTGIFLCDCNFERDLYADASYGSTYRTLYNAPEHLVLGKHASLEDARTRILKKAAAMVDGTDVDDVSLEILERVQKFRDERISRGVMSAEQDINDALLPPITVLSELNEETARAIGVLREDHSSGTQEEEDSGPTNFIKTDAKLSFHQLCKLVYATNIQLLGREGGCGKTTLLTKLFHHQLHLCEEDPSLHAIPLYVDAKNLAAKNELLLRYLAMHLMGAHTAMTDGETGEGVRKLAAAFSEKRQTPRYLLLIDGYNELPESSVKLLNEELCQFLPGGRYESVRVVISGRTLIPDLAESEFIQTEILKLDRSAIENYLHKKFQDKTSLFNILRIPMYLKLFADTDTHSDIQNKADLLTEFVLWQERKDAASKETQETVAMHHILLRHVMPMVAYGMSSGDGSESSFVLTGQKLKELIRAAQETIKDEDYQEYYYDIDNSFIDDVQESNIENIKSLHLSNAFQKYFLRGCKLLRKNDDDNFEFVHQVYRDFFCAWYLASEVRRSLNEKQCRDALCDRLLLDDVLEFVPDLLKEKIPRIDWEIRRWDRSCDQNSSLIKLLGLCRRSKEPASAIVVANILNMLRYVRRDNLSGLDLSGLDLTATKLQNCSFFQYDDSAQYTTNFAGATINRENLFEEWHAYPLRAACTNDTYVACLDEGGFLKLWEKKPHPLFPVKTITHVRYAAKQMLFSPDGSKLYAVTDHEILQIPIPEETLSQGQPQVLYRSAAQLCQIMLDQQDALLFSTAANPFNFKKLSDPNAQDRIDFHGGHTAAAVNSAGTCLVFGNFLGYDGLRIFDRDPEGTWQERKFGYALLLEEFVLALEALLQQLGLYHHFAKTNEDPCQRCSFFPKLQQEFMDRTHDFDMAPKKILARCMKKFGSSDVVLDEEQTRQLHALVQEHQQRIAAANSSLLYLNGRKITGLQFLKDSSTLLVSGVIDYQKKLNKARKYFKNTGKPNAKTELDKGKTFNTLVVTIDTETMDVREIHILHGQEPYHAFYCGEDILVLQKRKLWVYDKNRSVLASVKTGSRQMERFACAPNKKTFYLVSDRTIYEMDQDLRCIRSMSNTLRDQKLYYVEDFDGNEYLCVKHSIKKDSESGSILTGRVVNLHYGMFDNKYMVPCKVVQPPSDMLKIGQMTYAIFNNTLVSFLDADKQNEVTLQQSLHICGCDFRGIRGTAAEPDYLQTLYRMGGQTDPVSLCQMYAQTEEETFVPSQADFVPSQDCQSKRRVPTEDITVQGAVLSPDDSDPSQAGCWSWDKLQTILLPPNELDDRDHSILAWVDRLHYVTEDMLRELTEAGLIPDSDKDQDVVTRAMQTLHGYYGLLFRTQFAVKDTPVQPVLLTVNPPYGSKLLQEVSGQRGIDPFATHKGGGPKQQLTREILIQDPEVRGIIRRLSLNKWLTVTASRYKEYLTDYGVDSIMETNCHTFGKARVHGYLQLGKQAFFGQEIRSITGNQAPGDLWDKIKRLCILARYYHALECPGYQLDGMPCQPILVLIGESMEQCRQMNKYVEFVYPNVRKLYTFDSLLLSQEAAAGAENYLEFVDGIPHSVRLETLID